DRRDPYGQASAPSRRAAPPSLAGLKVAWLPACGNRLDPEVAAVTTAAVQQMEQAGAIVEIVQLDFVALERHFLVILESMLAARVGPHLERFCDRLDPSLVRAISLGLQHSAVALHEASYARTRCFLQLQALFDRHDVLVSPTVSAPPLPVEQDPNGIVVIDGQPAGTIRGAWYPYTYPMNLTGHPALSMPCGVSALGLPIGLQLAGRWHDDDFLLGIARLLEARLPGGR
ncbi:MAG: amidase family protein, partial [Lautropia sp.]